MDYCFFTFTTTRIACKPKEVRFAPMYTCKSCVNLTGLGFGQSFMTSNFSFTYLIEIKKVIHLKTELRFLGLQPQLLYQFHFTVHDSPLNSKNHNRASKTVSYFAILAELRCTVIAGDAIILTQANGCGKKTAYFKQFYELS